MPARKTHKTNGSKAHGAKPNGTRPNGKTRGARPFRVGRSRTGLGVFATMPIKKGTYIVEYLGPLLTNKQCDEIPDNRYLFEVNARWTIDGKSRKNVARYINHSCRPNADPIIRDRRIRIKAIKNIEAGDEINYDYGKDHFNAYIKPKGCLCDKCRDKRRKERAELRAANARKRARLARKASKGANPIA
jgi:SET domain-containing protein